MERTKKAQKNRKLERHEPPVFTPMRNDPAHRHVAGTGSKPGIRRTVKPFKGVAQERREEKYITRALSGVPRGTSILNWPCGCSRLLPLLKKLGYYVTSADSSSDVVGRIRLYGGLLGEDCVGEKDEFKDVDIFQTGFEDDFFGAVIVNQLFPCLPETQIRQLILKELRRVCTGPIIVSFFCNTMIHKLAIYESQRPNMDEMIYYFRLSRKTFIEEARECGLIVKKWVPRFGFRTRQVCVVLVRDKGYEGSFTSKLKP